MHYDVVRPIHRQRAAAAVVDNHHHLLVLRSFDDEEEEDGMSIRRTGYMVTILIFFPSVILYSLLWILMSLLFDEPREGTPRSCI